MKIVVGLGNPGSQYETSRHNMGFLCADYLIEKWNARGPTVKHQGALWQATIEGSPILIVKPQTFMNLSGRTVGPLFQFYKCQPSDLIVIYDELDYEPGQIRFKTGGSAGGHNGLKSIDESIGGTNTGYHRVRLGIGHPRNSNLRMDVADYVLGRIPDDQWNGLEALFEKAEAGIRLTMNGKILEAMNRYHGG